MRSITVLFFLCILLGCRNPEKNTGVDKTFTVATLKGPSSMGMIRLIDSISRAGNPDVRIEVLNEPLQVRKMMLDGSADFAILPTTMAAILYNKGLDYRLIAIPVWGTLYLFGSDTTITRWEDLRNKRVYTMARGMTPDVLFRYLLQENGISPGTDITLDYSFPTHIDLANAVVAGRAELAVISEPLVSLVMHRNSNVRPIFDLNREWERQQGIPMAQTAFSGSTEMLKYPQRTERLISAYERSSRWVNQNPDSAAALIVKHDILPDAEVARQSIPRSNLHFVRAGIIQSQIREYLEVFYHMNPDIVGGKIPDEDFFY
ncbi:MAG: ABC transporter substrate-binding protein [Bacteroidales bacterium]